MTLLTKLAHAEVSSTPVPNYPQVTTNAQVNTILAAPDGSQYIGGSFSAVTSNPTPTYKASNGTTINIPTSVPNTTMAMPDDYVADAVSDNNGGWYVGGDFENVGNVPYQYIVHILADGTVDTGFNLNLNGGAYSLIFDDAANLLYVGGWFTEVNGGTARNGLAAFDTTTGIATAFDPNLEDIANASSGMTEDMALSSDGQTLYVGGVFDTVNGVTSRNRAAAFDTTTGIATAFDAGLEVAWNTRVSSIVLNSDDSVVYLGGSYVAVNGGTARTNLTGFDATTGTVTAFDASFTDGYSQYVSSLAFDTDTDTLYAGGYFTEVNGGTVRNGVAAFNPDTGIATAFDPNLQAVNISVQVMSSEIALTADNQTLYVGGAFDTVNSNTPRLRFAAFDTTSAMATNFNPSPDNGPSAIAFSPDTQTLYAGGEFTYFGGQTTTSVPRNGLARILADGTVDPDFDPDLNDGANVSALTLSPDGTTLYVGGGFTYVNGDTVERWGFAALDVSTGIVTSLNPELSGDGWSPGSVNDIIASSDGTAIYVSGNFNTINGTVSRNYIAAFSATTGIVGSFNPELDGIASSIALSPDEGTIYVGGEFETVNGATIRNNLAAFNSTTGEVTAFNPNVNNDVNAVELSADGSQLYFGGQFTSVSGTTRRRLASVNTATGALTSFNPNVTGDSVYALALTPDQSTLYAGGGFTRVNGTGNTGTTIRQKVAGFNTTTGIANNFSVLMPGGSNYPTVRALAYSPDGRALYVGGVFLLSSTTTVHNNLAAFLDPSVQPVPDPDNGGGSTEDEGLDGWLANTGMSTQVIIFIAAALLTAGSAGIYLANRKKGSSAS